MYFSFILQCWYVYDKHKHSETELASWCILQFLMIPPHFTYITFFLEWMNGWMDGVVCTEYGKHFFSAPLQYHTQRILHTIVLCFVKCKVRWTHGLKNVWWWDDVAGNTKKKRSRNSHYVEYACVQKVYFGKTHRMHHNFYIDHPPPHYIVNIWFGYVICINQRFWSDPYKILYPYNDFKHFNIKNNVNWSNRRFCRQYQPEYFWIPLFICSVYLCYQIRC